MIPTPSIPAPYVGGLVTLPAGTPQNLLELIQNQLSKNCPASAVELQLWADSANSGSIMIGAASNLSGPLSQTNYAYKLTPTGTPRTYRSTYPGQNVPIGDLQVLSTNGGSLHIELWT